jgi:cytoskeletal protein CcmA (bactofilin family)
MIFSLGKAKSELGRSLETQALQRWRAVSVNDGPEFESIRVITSDTPASPEPTKVISLANHSAIELEVERTPEEFMDSFSLGDEPMDAPAQVELRLVPPMAPVSESIQTPIEPPRTTVPATPAMDTKAPVEEDIKRRFGANLRSALGQGTMIEGKLSFDSPVRIDGTMNGEIISSSVLIVGSQAQVQARIRVGSIIILGEVVGDIEAEDLVEIRNGGCFTGPVLTRRIAIEAGGIFQGRCDMIE